MLEPLCNYVKVLSRQTREAKMEDFDKATQQTYPLLDQYKKAWTTVYDSAKVAELKSELSKQVAQLPSQHPKLMEYFESQCWQIEQRWARPQEKDHSVN